MDKLFILESGMMTIAALSVVVVITAITIDEIRARRENKVLKKSTKALRAFLYNKERGA